jgi:hypothetical protein
LIPKKLTRECLAIEIGLSENGRNVGRLQIFLLYPTSLINRWFLSVLGATTVSPNSRSNSSFEIS